MRVKFKPVGATAFTDLGGTLGNVNIGLAYKKSNIMADQFGKTVLDQRVSAIDIKVTTEIAETQNKDNWKVVFPHGTEVVGSGPFAGATAFDFLSAIGDGSLSNAGELLLHPLSMPDSNTDFDYTFWKACSTAESEIVYSPENQAKLKIVWLILPDTSTQPARFARFGQRNLT